MKKLLLSILFLSFVSFGFAQKFNGGAIVGMAATQVAGDTYSGFNKVGAIGGFFVNLQPTQRSSFQMELYYVQKGSRKNADAVEGDYNSFLLRLSYVEMPLLYKYHIRWFAIEAGPSVAFFMSGLEELDGVDQKKDNFAKATVQINFGVVFTLAKNWKLGIRTNNSVTSNRNEKNTGDVRRFWSYGQYNDGLQFTLAYQFLHF